MGYSGRRKRILVELELATKEQVTQWFDLHPECKQMLDDYLKFDQTNWINEVFDEMCFRIHPQAGLIPSDLTDDLNDPEWAEIVYSEIYAVEVHLFLWLCVVRRRELDGAGIPIPDGKEIEFFSHDEIDQVVAALKNEVREYRRQTENSSVRWETRSWSNGKKFVYLAEIEGFVEAEASGEFGEIASVELSDIFDSTAQVVQSANGKMFVKATLLDEYVMEVETVEEAKSTLEEFKQLWGRSPGGDELLWN
jgi:hypothetical protein